MQRVKRLVDVPAELEAVGDGATVAVLDTGVGRHPDLEGEILSFRDFVGYRSLMYDDNGRAG